MKRRQRLHRGICPHCQRTLSYSVGLDAFADFAHFRQHKRRDGTPCPATMVKRASVVPVPRPGDEGGEQR